MYDKHNGCCGWQPTSAFYLPHYQFAAVMLVECLTRMLAAAGGMPRFSPMQLAAFVVVMCLVTF